MMRFRKLITLILVFCPAALTNPVDAQGSRVKVKFEVDGKEVEQKFKVVLYVNSEVIEPQVSEHEFVVPPEIRSSEKVNVRFLFGEYDLFFDSVYVSAFGTDWVVGVDHKPFDKENTASEEPSLPGKELAGIYYITFVSKKGLDTRMVVKVYK